jgi:hypothetical protein
MNQILLSILLLAFFVNCKQSSPCSPFDTSCTPLGYFLPDLIKPKSTASTASTATTASITFKGLDYLTILSPTSVKLDWTTATSTATGSIEYNVYRATTSGAQVFTTPLQTVAGTTTATITGITAGTNNYYIVRAKDSAGTVDTNTSEKAALFNGLIRFIPLDSGALTTGEKIGNAAVTAFATPPLTGTDRRGIVNNAYSLNGTSQYFQFPNSTPVALPSLDNSRTICLWARITNFAAAIPILVSYGGTVYFYFTVNMELGRPPFLRTGFFSPSAVVTGPPVTPQANWNFLCTVYVSGGYFNFLMNSTYSETINATNAGIDNAGNAFIGKYAGAATDFFPGSISDVSIWNRALTEAEMKAVSKN